MYFEKIVEFLIILEKRKNPEAIINEAIFHRCALIGYQHRPPPTMPKFLSSKCRNLQNHSNDALNLGRSVDCQPPSSHLSFLSEKPWRALFPYSLYHQ